MAGVIVSHEIPSVDRVLAAQVSRESRDPNGATGPGELGKGMLSEHALHGSSRTGCLAVDALQERCVVKIPQGSFAFIPAPRSTHLVTGAEGLDVATDLLVVATDVGCNVMSRPTRTRCQGARIDVIESGEQGRQFQFLVWCRNAHANVALYPVDRRRTRFEWVLGGKRARAHLEPKERAARGGGEESAQKRCRWRARWLTSQHASHRRHAALTEKTWRHGVYKAVEGDTPMFMAMSRRIARPLLASIFIVGGLDAVRNPGDKAKKAEVVTGPVSQTVGIISSDPETLVRANGIVQIGAGFLMAIGKFQRLAALALMASLVPTTYAGHRFWEETDNAARSQQQMHFLKNLGLLGGLIMVVFDAENGSSPARRARRHDGQGEDSTAVGARVRATVRSAVPKSEAAAGRATKVSGRTIRRASAAGRRAGRGAQAVAIDSAQKMAGSTDTLRNVQGVVKGAVRESGEGAAHAVQQATSIVSRAVRELEPLAQTAAQTGMDVARDTLSNLREQLPSN